MLTLKGYKANQTKLLVDEPRNRSDLKAQIAVSWVQNFADDSLTLRSLCNCDLTAFYEVIADEARS